MRLTHKCAHSVMTIQGRHLHVYLKKLIRGGDCVYRRGLCVCTRGGGRFVHQSSSCSVYTTSIPSLLHHHTHAAQKCVDATSRDFPRVTLFRARALERVPLSRSRLLFALHVSHLVSINHIPKNPNTPSSKKRLLHHLLHVQLR